MYQELRDTVAELTAPGQLFEMTTVEVNGQELRSWVAAPPTLRDLWLAVAGHGDADYLVYEDERLSYTQAHDHVARVRVVVG